MTYHEPNPQFGIDSISWNCPKQEQIDRTFRSYQNASKKKRRAMLWQLVEIRPINAEAKRYRQQLLKRMSTLEEKSDLSPLMEGFGHYERASKDIRRRMLRQLLKSNPPNAKSRYYKIELLKMIHEFETVSVL